MLWTCCQIYDSKILKHTADVSPAVRSRFTPDGFK